MSYGVGAALQAAVYQLLQADANLTSMVGTDVFDAAPAGTPPALYVTLGTEDARDRSDGTGRGAAHDFTVSVVTDNTGFQAAKDVAAAVSDALIEAPLTLARGRLVSLGFLRARARRVEGGTQRQIDLLFRARVEDN